MQRRTFLQLLTVPAVAQVLAACGDDSTKSSSNGGNASSLRGDALRITDGTDPAAAAAAINAFADDLFLHLTTIDPVANLVFSPASIALALAMTSAGAKGMTLDEMNQVLHITDPSAIHRSMNGLSSALGATNQSQDNTGDGGEGVSEVQLSIANSLWGQSGFSFEQAFLDLLSSEYGAGMELVDYGGPETARQAINEWVATETRDRIPELLAEGVITADSRLTLVNAIYLKANWNETFDTALTAVETFASPTGDVDVDMMHAWRRMAYASGDGWQAVEMPYVFHELALVVAVGETLDTVMPTVGEVTASLADHMVELAFPKFDIETSVSLADVLKEMGMPTAFDEGNADFSGMTTKDQLAIGDVIHQANITVDEEGTEAAAATAVVMVAVSAPPPATLVIDRPFTFWLRARTTGAVIFMGRVNDPSATRG